MKRMSDLLVGVVVLVVAASLVAGVLWLQQANVGHRERHVTARFRDVGSARVGNDVVVRGVRAGHIDAIELAPGGWVTVRMIIDPTVQMPGNPVALLDESSLFGEWEAQITDRLSLPRDPEVIGQIRDADTGGGAVLPGATLPGMAKLTAVAGQIAGNVATVADRFQTAFDSAAALELRGSIRNVADLSRMLSTTVRAHSTDLDTLSVQLRAAVLSLNRTTALTEAMAHRVDSAANGTQLRQMVQDASAAAAELRKASSQISDMSTRLTKSQSQLENVLNMSDSVMMKINTGRGSLGLFVNNPSLYQNSDSMMIQLRGLLADIQANPRKYVSVRIF